MVVITEVTLDYGRIFGPFPAVGHIPPSHFIGLLTTDERNEATNITINPNDNNLGNTWLPYVHPARTQEEQNVEAYVKDRNIYYRMIRIIKAGEELFVWYSTDFAQQLGIQPLKRTADTDMESLLTCQGCGDRFKYPFPLMAHTRFRCAQQFDKTATSDNKSINNNLKYKEHTSNERDELTHCFKKKDTFTGIKRSNEFDISDSPRKKLSVENCEENNNIASPSKLSPTTSEGENEHKDICSAFRKVEKSQVKEPEGDTEPVTPYIKNNSQGKLTLHSDELAKRQIYQKQTLQYGLQSSFNMMMPNWVVPQTSNGQFYLDPRLYKDRLQPTASDKMEIMSRISNMSSESVRSFTNNGMLSKQILMEQLRKTQFPYMHPNNPMVEKLLSTATPDMMQKPVNELCIAQNWCAKCNATFRMTSDLVYHMRSHHKREFDPMKRKREEKLQCNVCQETFKERHHLTRHMTSHS